MFKYHINYCVAVKLTDFGKKILELNHERLNELLVSSAGEEPKPFVLELNDKGMYETQLWSLMNVFGAYMAVGKDLPFEPEIELLGE